MGRAPLPALRVLRIGLAPGSADDLADVLPPEADVRDAGTLADALDRLDPAALPDLVLLRRDDPVRPARSALERLLEAAPLARVVALDGPWCASDGRTRDVCPAALRLPAEHAAARVRRELEALAGNLAPLPLTASREEIFEWDAEPETMSRIRVAPASRRCGATYGDMPPPNRRDAGSTPDTADASVLRIAVRSPDRAWGEELADRLQRLLRDEHDLSGATIAFVPGVAPGLRDPAVHDVDLVLCDVDPWRSESRAALIDLRTAHPRAALVALSGWILPELERACRTAGCHALWSKLADPDHLVPALRTQVANALARFDP